MLANDHFVGRREMAGVELPGILVSFGSLDSSLVDATDSALTPAKLTSSDN